MSGDHDVLVAFMVAKIFKLDKQSHHLPLRPPHPLVTPYIPAIHLTGAFFPERSTGE
jgi:hypothetical protein